MIFITTTSIVVGTFALPFRPDLALMCKKDLFRF